MTNTSNTFKIQNLRQIHKNNTKIPKMGKLSGQKICKGENTVTTKYTKKRFKVTDDKKKTHKLKQNKQFYTSNLKLL